MYTPKLDAENPICAKCGYDLKSNYRWESVYARWNKHSVNQIKAIVHNPKVHGSMVWYFKPKGYAVPFIANPVIETARHLTHGIVTANAEIYAAFALHLTTVEHHFFNKHNPVQLKEVVWNALQRMGPRKGWYWWGTAKHVTPVTGSREVTRILDKAGEARSICWCSAIEAAAMKWKDLADTWEVIKYPNPYEEGQLLNERIKNAND